MHHPPHPGGLRWYEFLIRLRAWVLYRNRFYFVHSTYWYVRVLYYRCTHRCHRGLVYFYVRVRKCIYIYGCCKWIYNWRACVLFRSFSVGQFTYFERMRTHAPVGKRTHICAYSSSLSGWNVFLSFSWNTNACAFGACAIY